MFSELLSRESRTPPILGVVLAAVMMGSVAVATAQASLPTRKERAEALKIADAEAEAAAEHAGLPKFFFASPLAGYVVNSPFGMRKMPWEEGGRLHEGVDIAAPAGAPVRATMAGVVVRSGVDKGYGRFIEIRHGSGLTSLYAHLGRVARLKPGAPVTPGMVVGFVGSSGRSTGSHLHFEIRLDGKPLNPVVFMGRAFATEADLPLDLAARIPRRVRVAQVSNWPKEILAKKALKVADAGDGRVRAVVKSGGRVSATIVPAPASTPTAPADAVPASAREVVAPAPAV